MSEAAQAAVLGAVLREPRRGRQVRTWLRAADFTPGWHREVYTVLVEQGLYAQAPPPGDLASDAAEITAVQVSAVVERLRRRAEERGQFLDGPGWERVHRDVAALADQVPDASRIAAYGQIVARAAVERALGPDGGSAEQSLLSALLAHPAQGAHLRHWLRGEDFADPLLGRMYRELVEDGLYGEPRVVGAAGEDVARVTVTALRTALVTAAQEDGWEPGPGGWPAVTARLAELAAGATDSRADHVVPVGKQVLQLSIQRQVASAGRHLQLDAAVPAGEPAQAPAIATEDLVRAVDELRHRWDQVMGRAPAAVTKAITASQEHRATETAVLASLLQDPGQAVKVKEWLRADDFTVPDHQSLYRLIIARAAAGEPVDAILLAKDARRNGWHGLDEAAIKAVGDSGRPGEAQARGRELLAARINVHVQGAADAVAGSADGPSAAVALGHLRRAAVQASRARASHPPGSDGGALVPRTIRPPQV
ncbi:DnaB-like helicase N-terminal domain-containing protein [Kitasatospora sp. NPDC048540]|uniref:DnaB-like helicase N-terminal domain-containing protein n=1 Tax=Kitasatospora sp. NPDC048540 TaxID=3155634 RepID=UPI0033E559DA